MIRRWTFPTHGPFEVGDRGTEYSNPVVVENTLVFGNQSIGLISIYPILNQTRWTLPIRNGVVSPLTADHGAVFFGGGDGYFYSVSLETGKVNWKYDVRNPIVSRPTVSGGRVFVTSTDDTLYAFDAGTGKWLWHYRRRSAATATILGASAPLVDGNDVIAGLSDGYLVDLSLQDGQLKWEKKLQRGATKFMDVDAHPVLENGVLYVPSYDGALYALKRDNGDFIWRFDAGGSKEIVIDGDLIYFPSSDGNIYALQKSNAKVLWKFELDHGVPTRLVVTDHDVIVGSSYEYLYAIDKNTGQGRYRYDVGSGSGFSGAPAYDPVTKQLYILSGAGNLYCFKLQSKVNPTKNKNRS